MFQDWLHVFGLKNFNLKCMKWGYVSYHFLHRYINYHILCNEKATKQAKKKAELS